MRQNLIPKILGPTDLANSGLENAVVNSIQSRKYNEALNLLQAQVQPIQYDRFIPNEIHNDPLSTLRSLTKGFDGILKDRLLELNQVASAYISTLIRQMRLLISSMFDKVNYDTHKVDKGITKIQEIMKVYQISSAKWPEA